MTPAPTTSTVPSTISADYARRVGKQFGRISASERDDLVTELAARLDAASPLSYADLVQRFGTPQAYANEMAEAMGEAPRPARRRRWIFPTAALIILIVGAAVAWSRKTDISKYPIGFASSMVPEGGAIESVGSTLLVHVDPAKIAEVSLEVRNDGAKAVRIESLDPALGVQVNPDGGLAVSDQGIPPIWSPLIRVFPQADPQGVVALSFDDPSGSDFQPFDLAAGDHVVLSLRGPINYCITAEASIGDRLRMHVTINGRQRIVQGPEVIFKFDDCP